MLQARDIIQKLSRDPSAMARAFRSQYRSGGMPYYTAANKTKFLDDDIDGGMELLLEEHERNPHARSLEMLGEYHINNGQNVVAKALLKDCFNTYGNIHVTNLIFAGLERTVALVDDDRKILYIALPKCASSTIKNYFTFAKYSETYGEFVHFKHNDMYRIVSPEDLETRYGDYFKFTVVRDPLSRVRSYFTSNISNNALRREAHGARDFMGLTTTPGPVVFVQKFFEYRQMFIDFRHHTDPMVGYLKGMHPLLNKVYRMSDLETVREFLSDRYGVDIPNERSMVTQKPAAGGDGPDDAMFAALEDFYREDYSTLLS